jgi:Family of unknown function (DUF6533)
MASTPLEHDLVIWKSIDNGRQLVLASTTLIIYDYLLTLDQEVITLKLFSSIHVLMIDSPWSLFRSNSSGGGSGHRHGYFIFQLVA